VRWSNPGVISGYWWHRPARDPAQHRRNQGRKIFLVSRFPQTTEKTFGLFQGSVTRRWPEITATPVTLHETLWLGRFGRSSSNRLSNQAFPPKFPVIISGWPHLAAGKTRSRHGLICRPGLEGRPNLGKD
jgi:hypothetical protein